MSQNQTEDTVKTLAEVVTGVLEKAPIYEDAAQPALREIGQGLGGMLKMVVLPLKMLGYKADQLLEDFEEKLNKKGETIPKENLQAPDPMIAGPVIQSLGYTMHEENLRNMFTNLLVTGMNSALSNDAHPAFVEVIKQLSPDEAKVVIYLSEMFQEKSNDSSSIGRYRAKDVPNILPIVNFSIKLAAGGTSIIKRNVCLITEKAQCRFADEEERYIDNLSRLGILRIRFDTWFTNADAYQEMERNLDGLRSVFHAEDGRTLTVNKGILEITGFGRTFFAACVVDPSEKTIPRTQGEPK